MIGTFGGARLVSTIDNTNSQGFPPVIHDGNNKYCFKYVIPSVKSVGMKRRARYIQKECFGRPESLLLTLKEAYLLAK